MSACPICAKPENGHVLCAICMSTNATTRLCDFCRAEPANAGWSEDEFELGVEEDIAGARVVPSSVLTLAELCDKRMRVAARDSKIVELLCTRHFERVPRRDRRGHGRGSYVRERFLTSPEIAKIVGCSPQYVRRVRARYFQEVRKIIAVRPG